MSNFGYRKNLCFRGLCLSFLSIFICLAEPKNFAGEPFHAVFHKNSGSEKVYGKKGVEYQKFASKIPCLTVPKHFVEEPFCALFPKISGREKVNG